MKKLIFACLPFLAIVIPLQISANQKKAQYFPLQTVQDVKEVVPAIPPEYTPTPTPETIKPQDIIEKSALDRVEKLSVVLVEGVKKLDPAIIDVRPSSSIEVVEEEGKKKNYVQWNPAVTLQKGTSEAKQKEIAIKLTEYVVKFHYKHEGGIPIANEDVKGGIFAFMEGKEGDNWQPSIGHVAFDILRRRPLIIDVRLGLRLRKPDGTITNTCCDEGEKIGRIQNDNFVVENTTKRNNLGSK